jgi:hypothetical protein
LTNYLASDDCKLDKVCLDWKNSMSRADFCEFMDSLTAHYSFYSYNFREHEDFATNVDLSDVVNHFVKLNKFGRRLIYDHTLNPGLVPLLLGAVKDNRSILFDVLRSRPDFVKSSKM